MKKTFKVGAINRKKIKEKSIEHRLMRAFRESSKGLKKPLHTRYWGQT